MISRKLSTSAKFAALYERAPALAEFCQALYPLIVAHADDFGRMQGDPFTVKHQVLPISPRPVSQFAEAVQALHDVGLVCWYEIHGRKYLEVVKFEEHQAGLHKRTTSEFPAPPGGSSGKFPEIPVRTEQKGTEGNRTEGKGTEPPAAEAPAPADLVRVWNETVEYLPKAQRLTPARERHAAARLKENPDFGFWRTVFARMDASPFCRGSSGRGWRADFDFAIKPDTFTKVLEGKYDDRRSTGPPQTQSTLSDAEFRRAEMYRRSAYGRCPHDPKCGTYNACVAAIAHDIRGKGAA